jgi:hypothetical protein
LPFLNNEHDSECFWERDGECNDDVSGDFTITVDGFSVARPVGNTLSYTISYTLTEPVSDADTYTVASTSLHNIHRN